MQAPKDMATSCDKSGDCAPRFNAWGFLPDSEAKKI